MRVRVLFFGPLAERLGRREEMLELAEGATAREVYAHYSRQETQLGELGRHVLMAVNQEFSAPDTPLQEADEVALLPPMSGGSVGAGMQPQVWVNLTREVVDREAIRARVSLPEAGGVVLFDGVVRNQSAGRATLRLIYEAYEAMALKQMQAIAEEALSKWPIRRVAMQHRLGTLEIGESSIVIAVSASHRRPAFEACAWLIDTLKRTVPIWKKELFADGSEWVEGAFPETLAGQSAQSLTNVPGLVSGTSLIEGSRPERPSMRGGVRNAKRSDRSKGRSRR